VTIARGAVLAALVVGAVVLGYLLLLRPANPAGYVLLFQNAGQLVEDTDVQVGGRRVGRVVDIVLTDDNQARVDIEVEDEFAPLPRGTKATIRAASLSGVANRYIALDLGPNNAPKLDEGSVLDAAQTTSPVDLDQLFNTLDPETRRSLQQVIQGSATWYEGKGRQANDAAKYFSPALSSTTRIVRELTRDQQTFESFVVNTSKVMTALSERRGDLSALVGNANATARAIGSENASLARALGLLPGTLRRANTTFVNLRGTLSDLDVLVAESKPATRRLAPLLRELRPLVRDARPTIADLRALVRRPGADNDLVELLGKAPRLASVARPAFRNSAAAFDRSLPVLDFARPYAPDLGGWLRDFGQTASNYDANGHYARIEPIFPTFAFTDDAEGGKLTAQPPGERDDGLQTGYTRRCPGAASQAAADGSAPFADDGLDCDPTKVLPAP